MLRAFLDASKTFPGKTSAPALTMAGFVGEAKVWSRFQRHWRAARKKSGLDYFHMVDYEALQKSPYSKWGDQQYRAILDNLISLTIDIVDFGVTVSITKDQYDSLTLEEK